MAKIHYGEIPDIIKHAQENWSRRPLRDNRRDEKFVEKIFGGGDTGHASRKMRQKILRGKVTEEELDSRLAAWQAFVHTDARHIFESPCDAPRKRKKRPAALSMRTC